jgi:alkaline phosphatase D
VSGGTREQLHDARARAGALGRARLRAVIGSLERRAQQLLIAQLEHTTIRPNWFWQDAWDGYPLARQRLLNDVVGTKLRNPVFLTGDWHSTFVNELKLNFKDPNAPAIATEFVTPAITTGGDGTPYGPYYAPMIPFNPHIKYYEGDRRGYFKATVTPERMQMDLRFMTSVENQAGTGYSAGSWVVEDGIPGAFIA